MRLKRTVSTPGHEHCALILNSLLLLLLLCIVMPWVAKWTWQLHERPACLDMMPLCDIKLQQLP